MPIYEFRCKACGLEYERLVFSSSEVAPCPECDSADAERMMSMFASKSGEKFTPSSGNASCAGCTSGNCSSCG